MTDQSRKILNMVLALLVAIGAWIFVVYNYDPMTEVSYSEVPVNFTGEATLAKRGLAVSEASSESISVTLRQKRIDTLDLSAEDIEVVADVSECSAGENNVKLRISGPTDTTVMRSDTETVKVDVGRVKNEVMDILVEYPDNDDDTEPVVFDMSLMQADVACTEDTMKNIDHLAAFLNKDSVGDKLSSYTARVSAVDKDGNVLQHVVITPEEISLDAYAGYTKTVDLEVPVKNKADEDYERSYTVPDKVTIKGRQDVIGDITSVKAAEINLGNRYESGFILLEYDLPEDVYIANESLGQSLRLIVTQK